MGPNLKQIVVVFLISCFLSLTLSQVYPAPGSRCQVKEGVPGICKKLKECPAAISNLKSDVKPNLCGGRIQATDAVVCCRTEPRISEKKCLEYQNELAGTERVLGLLPFEFLSDENKTFICDPMPNKLIVGGRDAKPEEFPHQVALGFETDDKTVWGCGGSLISKDFVLTAAHCIDTQQYGRPKLVLVGDLTLSNRTQPSRTIARVSEYFKHPDYKKPLSYHDIALVRLDRPLKISKALRPACLPIAEKRMDKIIETTATGFGKLGYAEPQSDILQTVTLTRFNLTNCNEFYQDQPDKVFKYPQNIIRKQICAGDPEGVKDSCQGDSGGPLSIRLEEKKCIHYIIGITSFGSAYCGSGVPGVYTNVQSYMDWIESIVWPNER